MTFKKGHTRYGGKKKGHRSLKVADILAEKKFYPIEELLKLYVTVNDALKVKILIELQTYIETKPRPLEMQDAIASMSTSELVVLVKEKLPELEATQIKVIDEQK
jgi:hypothetical protein